MVEVRLDECSCVCDSARVVEAVAVARESTAIEIILVVVIVIIIIAGLVVAFSKLREDPPEEEGFDSSTYY